VPIHFRIMRIVHGYTGIPFKSSPQPHQLNIHVYGWISKIIQMQTPCMKYVEGRRCQNFKLKFSPAFLFWAHEQRNFLPSFDFIDCHNIHNIRELQSPHHDANMTLCFCCCVEPSQIQLLVSLYSNSCFMYKSC
jgi:hypothetical protein